MIIDERFIKDFVDNCLITDLMPNAQGIIENIQLSNYIGEIVNNIIESAEENIDTEILNNKIKYEIETALSDDEAKILNIFHLLSMSIHNYLVTKYADENSIYKKVLFNISHFSLKLFQIIFSLYLSGCIMGILSQIRVLYENYIIFRFIGKYPILCEDYFEHAVYRKYSLLKEYWKELSTEEEIKMNNIAKRHDDSFQTDYGWTYKIITKNNKRKIITMLDDLNLDNYKSIDYKELYKVANNYIHPSTFAVFHDKIVYGKLTKDYLKMAVELMTDNIIYLMKFINCDKKEEILIKNVLYGLREDLHDEPQIIR